MGALDENVTICRSELAAAFREAEASAVRKWIDDTSMRVRGQTNYYSAIRFQVRATQFAPGPPIQWRLQIDRAERQAFAYQIGSSPQVAGFVAPTGVPGYPSAATLTQTNLSKAKETRNGEKMIVTGISAFLLPGSDQALAAWVWQHASVEAVKNDTNRSPLGPLAFFPALSSVNGQGESFNVRPESAQSTSAIIERFRSSEGLSGYYDLSAAPIVWTPSGKTDSSLYLAINLDEAYDEIVTERAPTAPLVEAWSPAAAQNSAPNGPNPTPRSIVTGTYVDVLFRFDGTTEQAMSQNQAA